MRQKLFIDNKGRECRICREYKIWDNFYKNSANSTGMDNRCKSCHNEYQKQRFQSGLGKVARRIRRDPQYKLKEKVRGRIRSYLSRYITGKSKNPRFCEELGCTAPEWCEWLESHFEQGMNWSNYGNGPGKWCVDHTYPTSKCADWSNLEEVKKIMHYTNTKPMWFMDNCYKSDKLPEE